MIFEKLDINAICGNAAKFNLAAGGTTIETKVGPFWRTDGYDDKVPTTELSSGYY